MNKSGNTFSKREIFVNEVVLHGADEVSLVGFIHNKSQYSETRFVISRTLLRKLLLENGATGREILNTISESLKIPHAVPLEINLVDKFGLTQALSAGNIQLQIPFRKIDVSINHLPEQVEWLLVEDVTPVHR